MDSDRLFIVNRRVLYCHAQHGSTGENFKRAYPNTNEIRILRVNVNVHLDDAITDGGVNSFLCGSRTTAVEDDTCQYLSRNQHRVPMRHSQRFLQFPATVYSHIPDASPTSPDGASHSQACKHRVHFRMRPQYLSWD